MVKNFCIVKMIWGDKENCRPAWKGGYETVKNLSNNK